MIYQGSAARPLGTAAPQQAPSSFDVVEGRGLDAAARQGINPRFWHICKLVIAACALMFVLCCARVALTSATVQTLQANAETKTQLSQAEDANRELRIESAVLSNNSRISSIATQNLGMVYAGAGEALTVSVPAAS